MINSRTVHSFGLRLVVLASLVLVLLGALDSGTSQATPNTGTTQCIGGASASLTLGMVVASSDSTCLTTDGSYKPLHRGSVTSSVSDDDCAVTNNYGDQQQVPCTKDGGWLGYDNCYYKLKTPQPAAPAGKTTGAWYTTTCYGANYYATGLTLATDASTDQWLDKPPPGTPTTPSGIQLITLNKESMGLDAPTTYRKPNLTGEMSQTVVNAHTWFWTTTPLTPKQIAPPPAPS